MKTLKAFPLLFLVSMLSLSVALSSCSDDDDDDDNATEQTTDSDADNDTNQDGDNKPVGSTDDFDPSQGEISMAVAIASGGQVGQPMAFTASSSKAIVNRWLSTVAITLTADNGAEMIISFPGTVAQSYNGEIGLSVRYTDADGKEYVQTLEASTGSLSTIDFSEDMIVSGSISAQVGEKTEAGQSSTAAVIEGSFTNISIEEVVEE